MSDRTRPEDDPALRDKINREATERGVPPHTVIDGMAHDELQDERFANMEAFFKHTNDRLEKMPPDQRKLFMELRDDQYRVLDYLLDLNTRERAARIENAYLRQERDEYRQHTDKHADAAAQLSDKHLEEDQKLAAAHEQDLRLLHRNNEIMAKEQDRITDIQEQELDNLKGRQEVETLKLAKSLSQERGRDDGMNAQEQARDQTERPSPSDTAERRAWEHIREARQRREDEKNRDKDRDRDDGREL